MVLVILTLAINKAEHWRVGAFELRYWGRLLRVPWTARRSNQSVLKEINNGYSLEGLMLKLKLQYFGYLMWRANSLEKILMLGKIEGRRRGWQKMRWSHSITYSMDMDLSELQARLLEWVAFLFSRGILPTQGSNPGLLHCRQILYHWTTGEVPVTSYAVRNETWSEKDLFHPALSFGRLTLQTTSTPSTSGLHLLAAGGNRRVGGKRSLVLIP